MHNSLDFLRVCLILLKLFYYTTLLQHRGYQLCCLNILDFKHFLLRYRSKKSDFYIESDYKQMKILRTQVQLYVVQLFDKRVMAFNAQLIAILARPLAMLRRLVTKIQQFVASYSQSVTTKNRYMVFDSQCGAGDSQFVTFGNQHVIVLVILQSVCDN